MKKSNKIITLAVTAAMATTILSCTCLTASAATSPTRVPSTPAFHLSDDGMANPWTNCNTDFKMAQEISGINFYIPGLSNYSIRAAKGLVEITVNTNAGKTVVFRKGTGAGNISGIYGNYDYVSVDDARIADLDVMLGLGKDGKTYVATWTDGEFSYSISSNKGMTSEEAIENITNVPVKNNTIPKDLNYTAINDARLANIEVIFGMKDGKVYSAEWSTGGVFFFEGCSTEDAINEVLDAVNQ